MNAARKRQKKTLLGYYLTPKQDILVNHLLPAIGSCVLYILLFACDVGVVFRHYKDENPIWSSLTLFFMYLPAIGSYYVTLTSLELWPEVEGFGLQNLLWVVVKTLEHLLFPVWSMWRYAERMFWSIEGIRTTDEDDRNEILANLNAPRTIELYAFLQSYLHSLPQVLLQIFILMRHQHDISIETVGVEAASITINLLKVAVTTAFFQRFKSQKIAGRQYPWLKTYKLMQPDKNADQTESVLDGPTTSQVREESPLSNTGEDAESDVVFRQRPSQQGEEQRPNRQPLRRSSSDFYLQPTTSLADGAQEFFQKHVVNPVKRFNRTYVLREASVVDGAERAVFSETDFNITRLRTIKGLPEDDFVGKLISVVWWFCFLLARILAISTFFYFYPKECCYILCTHFVVCIAILLYDVKTGDLKRDKVMFFIFIGYVYLFVVIEFKIQFKKAKLVYCGFFILVYLQNFIMCLVWWFNNMEDLERDFWFRYVFVIVVMGSIFSITAMLFYLNVIKPKKVVVSTVPVK